MPFANVRTPASSIRYCSGRDLGMTGTLHVSPDCRSIGNGANGWDEIYVIRKKRGFISVFDRLCVGMGEREGIRTSPVTTPLRPVFKPSTLHQTPPPTPINRISRSKSGGACEGACTADGDARESVWRCVRRVVWCYIKERVSCSGGERRGG